MGHFVFLAGSYYPDFSAVGYCGYQVQKCLLADSKTTVVSFKNNASQSMEEVHLGIRIQRIETDWMRRRNRVQDERGVLAAARLFGLRSWGAIRRLVSRQTIDQSLVRAYLDRLNHLEPRPSAIVPLVFPFEAVLAALEYKESNPDVAVFPYLFDDFVESGSLHVLKIARWLKRGRHLCLERTMLEQADAVLSMHPLRKHFERNFDRRLLGKITFLEHPLLSKPQEYPKRSTDKNVRLCFTGSLIRKVREPDYLLNLLRKLRIDIPLYADFFVMGNDAVKVRTEKIGNLIHIVNHGRVSKDQADRAVQNADILINIGEAKGQQISSKIFEYMSTGKPIVHLAYVENDAVSKILEKYPLALSLIQSYSYMNENVRRIEEFILKTRRRQLSFEDVKKIFPEALPETTSAHLTSLVHQFHKNHFK